MIYGLIVALHLAAIHDADRVVVMKQSVCVEMGTPAELSGRNGEYYRLQSTQA